MTSMLTDTPPMVSLHDIERVRKKAAELREELRRCISRVDANRTGGTLFDNTVRESLRLAQSLRKAEARLQSLRSRRNAELNTRSMAATPEIPGLDE